MKLFVFCILVFIELFLIPRSIFAHPLDVSNTTLTLASDKITWVIYIHPVQIDKILLASGIAPESLNIDTYYQQKNILYQYIKTHQSIQGCNWWDFSILDGLMVDEIYSAWFPISYTILCKENTETLQIENTFCSDIPLQTNRINIYTQSGGKIDTIIMTSSYTKAERSIIQGKNNSIDSDGDGLSDSEESIYQTSPLEKDTDKDGYTDKEELSNSWNPLNPEPGPWQTSREYRDEIPTQKHTLTDASSGVWWGALFEKTLKIIRQWSEWIESISFSSVALLLFSLGFLHAFWPWHSKSILASYVIDRRVTLFGGFLYAWIFSVVHILDILVVALIAKFLFILHDPSLYFQHIQKWSILVLTGVTLYLVARNLSEIRKPLQRDEEEAAKNTRIPWVLAILSWLTPCIFWWSIFLLLFSVGKMEWILPLLFLFWLGIFSCLAIVVIGLSLFKRYTFQVAPPIVRYTPLLSSIFLLGSSIYISSIIL